MLRAWIRHGTIYGKAKALTGYGLGRIEGWPDDQTIDDIAADTVIQQSRPAILQAGQGLVRHRGFDAAAGHRAADHAIVPHSK